MNRWTQRFFAVWLVALGLAASMVFAATKDQITELEQKLNSNQAISASDLQLAREIHDQYGALIDVRRAEELYKQSLSPVQPTSRPPRPTLDEYTWQNTEFEWIDITADGTVLPAEDDFIVLSVNLGFNFDFYEQSYSTVNICSNGWISFSSEINTWDNAAIPNEFEPNNAVYGFWDDLAPNVGGTVYYYQDEENERFIISWVNVMHYNGGQPTDETYTFQIVLYPGGNVVVNYNSISTGTEWNNSTCTVGIESAAGDEALQVCFDGAGTLPEDSTSIFIGQPDGVPFPVTNLAAAVNGLDVTLTWIDPTQDTNGNLLTPENIQVWDGAPGVGILLGTVSAGVQTYSYLSAPAGNHTFYVRAFADPYFGGSAAVPAIVGNPSYIEGFELTDGLWVSDGGWARGTPDFIDGPPAAHGGSNVWGTVLDGDYPDDACFNLTLAPELEIVSPGATVEFWAWYDIETGFDGTNFWVSVDNGASWEVVAPEDGYPGTTNDWNECNPNNPAWTGHDQGFWEYIVIPIGTYNGQTPRFRLTHGTDGSVTYPGFYFDDMTIWGLADPVGGDVSGTVTLDGGSGDVTNVVVRADGLGNPNTNPAANGDYLLEDVLVGNRVVWAALAGYEIASTNITLTEAGLTDVDLTLVREAPPAPTNLDASVNNATGEVTLNWDASPDLLVDSYNLYLRANGEDEWIFAQSYETNSGVYIIPSAGIWHVAVSAVDEDVSTPVESELSELVWVLYGELPPTDPVASGDSDDTISLFWFEPGTPGTVELAYDNGENTMFGSIGWDFISSPPPFGWVVSRFASTEAFDVSVTKIKAYFNEEATPGDPIQVGVFFDDGFGMPESEPEFVLNAVVAPYSGEFQEFNVLPPVVAPDGIFYVGVRQMTTNELGLGGDIVSPFPNNTFFWGFDSEWDPYAPFTLTIPMIRCEAVGFIAETQPVLQPEPVNVPLNELITEWERLDRYSRATGDMPRPIQGFRLQPTPQFPFLDEMPISVLLDRANNAVAAHSPSVSMVAGQRDGNHALDNYYIVYRDGIDIGHPTDESFDDTGRTENVVYSYHVTAYYEDSAAESGPSPTVEMMCNMEPAAPGNLHSVGVGDASIRLLWNDPTLNRDGSPCVDLTNIYVYRDGAQIATVAPGIEEFTDTPPAGAGTYTYALAAVDEVPNVSARTPGLFSAVGNPSYINGFEFDDGLWVPANEVGWEWGQPTGADAPAPHTGSNVWGTLLSTDYPGDACWQIDLNLGLAVASPNASFEFWAAWDIETATTPWDGCNFKVSVDDGATWQIVHPDNGYTFPSAQTDNTCLGGQDVWCGYGHDWEYITIPIGEFEGEVPIFRLDFGSDPIVNGAGFFFDDMIIWGLQEPVTGDVTGTVTLDGGAGSIEAVEVRANGLGQPLTNPDQNGDYTLSNVLVGNRTIFANLSGYQPATAMLTVTEAGPNVADLTLVRNPPPAPTGLTGNVNNGTGLVTLDWDNTTDPLVDSYNVYKRLHENTEWIFAETSDIPFATHTLTLDGIWDFSVTAVDEDASSPIESPHSDFVTVLYGELPPTQLTVNGNFDNKMVLNWLEPGVDPGLELAYDDNTAEQYVLVQNPNGSEDLLAVRFTPPSSNVIDYPITVSTASIFQQTMTPMQELLICPDLSGAPDYFNPYASFDGVAPDAAPGWAIVQTYGEVTIPTEGDFWIVVQLPPGVANTGLGADDSSPEGRSAWTLLEAPFWNFDFDYNYMVRATVRSMALAQESAGGYLLSVGDPGGYRIDELPVTALCSTASRHARKSDLKSTDARKETGASKATDQAKALGNNTLVKSVSRKSLRAIESQAEPFIAAPRLEWQRERNRHTLDDIVYYIVYRDGADIGHPTGTTYEDLGRTENQNHTYTVTAFYDNDEESPPAGPVTAACNLAPMAPGNLTGTPIGNTQMSLSWTAPTQNADGTPLVDLTSFQVYRSGQLITTLASDNTTFTDTPPENDQPYSWTVVALDEVPNASAPSFPFNGFVVSPWEVVDYEWIDITEVGTALTMGVDDNQGPFPVGFSYNFLGNTYTEIRICSNGWLSPTSTSPEYINEAIPSPDEPNNAMYGFWDDMNAPNGGQIYYWADAAEQRFIVSWIGVPHWGTTDLYTYQIILTDDGALIYNYHTIPNNTSTTIGVENADGTDAIQVCFDGSGDFLPENGSAIAFWAGPAADIQGTIRVFGTNAPIAGAELSIEGLEDVVTTDQSGFYSFGVEPGTWTLTVHKLGFCDHTWDPIVIADDEVITRNASLYQPAGEFSVTSLNIIGLAELTETAEFVITNPAAGCEFTFDITTSQPWLSVEPASGAVEPNASQTVTVTVDAAGIAPGEYNGLLSIEHNDTEGLYEIPVLFGVLDAEDAPELPTEFAFHSAYPNPFNAATVFRFDVPQSARVELVVYNVMGQEVARPVNEVFAAGRHRISFTANHLPSGMYIARLKAGSFTALQKIVLLK